jgi:hypothetical protein
MEEVNRFIAQLVVGEFFFFGTGCKIGTSMYRSQIHHFYCARLFDSEVRKISFLPQELTDEKRALPPSRGPAGVTASLAHQ